MFPFGNLSLRSEEIHPLPLLPLLYSHDKLAEAGVVAVVGIKSEKLGIRMFHVYSAVFHDNLIFVTAYIYDFCFEIECHYVAQASLKLAIYLFLPPE